MPSEVANVIAYIGAAVGSVGGGVGLFNARKAVLWKRAELANSHLRELSTNQDLVFACRALEWNGGRLVVPDVLRPLLPDGTASIVHDPEILKLAMRPGLLLADLERDPRVQLYRTAVDTLLSRLNLIARDLDRNLFAAQDVDEVGYWVLLIKRVAFLEDFIETFGYGQPTRRLRAAFGYKAALLRGGRDERAPRTGRGTITRGGFGPGAQGRSAGG